MEARALYNFNATCSEEMSMTKNEMVKILSEEDKNWYQAEKNGIEGIVPANHLTFNYPLWYMRVSKDDSVELLKDKRGAGHPEGAFLVRPSVTAPGELSLSVRIKEEVQHYKILRTDRRDKYFLWNDADKFSSVNELVAYYRSNSVSKIEQIYLKDMRLPKFRASYAFQAGSEDEVDLAKGDIVVVLDRRDKDWWLGQLEKDGKTGKQSIRGLFPATYVTSCE